MSLDSYLEGLTKEAEQERVEKVYLKTASNEELKALLGMEKVALKPGIEAMEGAYITGKALESGRRKEAALLEAGDSAGRVLAKLAATGSVRFKGSEIQEALQEAKEREDIEGRARKWQTAGGALGAGLGAGTTGTLGYAISKALGAKSGIPGAALGAIGGGLGGGYLGARIGKQEGAEEAAADRVVSAMRARRNRDIGAMHGYMAARGQRPFQSRR